MNTSRFYFIWIGCALALALIAFLGLSAYFFRMGLLGATAELSAIQNATLNASRTLYGTVTAVDSANRSLSFRVLNPYKENGTPTVVMVEVPTVAIISYEELRAGPDGTYTSALSAPRHSLSDIQLNDRVKVVIEPDMSGKILTARIILFGNPL